MALRALEDSGTIRRMSRQHWGSGSIYLRGRRLWISYPCGGKQKKESAKTDSEAQAAKLLRQRLAEVGKFGTTGPQFDKVRVDELLDDVIENYKANGKSVEWCEIEVAHLRPHFGISRASAVGTEQINAYIKKRRALGRKNSTINNELAILRRAFKLGADCEPPKVLRVPKIPELEVNNTRKGFFEHETYKAVKEHLPPEIAAVFEFAYFTGCRREEILSLEWPQHDPIAGVIRLHAGETKNKDSRVIPLTGELAKLLKKLRAERDDMWPWSKFIFTRAGYRIKDFRGAWNAALEKAGIEERKLLHDCRRTGVRNLIRSGVSRKVAKLISGHKTDAVFERYQIVEEEELTEAMKKVAAHLKKRGGKK